MFSLPYELVFQQVRKHIPAIICYGLAKAEFAAFLVFRHRLDANILNVTVQTFGTDKISTLSRKSTIRCRYI